MPDPTPPIWEAPDEGAIAQESSPDTEAAPSGSAAVGEEPVPEHTPDASATHSVRSRAARALKNVSAGTVAVALLAVVALSAFSFAAGRVTAPDTSDVAAGDTTPDADRGWQRGQGPGDGQGNDGYGWRRDGAGNRGWGQPGPGMRGGGGHTGGQGRAGGSANQP